MLFVLICIHPSPPMILLARKLPAPASLPGMHFPTKLKEKLQRLPLQRTIWKKGKGMGLSISDGWMTWLLQIFNFWPLHWRYFFVFFAFSHYHPWYFMQGSPQRLLLIRACMFQFGFRRRSLGGGKVRGLRSWRENFQFTSVPQRIGFWNIVKT